MVDVVDVAWAGELDEGDEESGNEDEEKVDHVEPYAGAVKGVARHQHWEQVEYVDSLHSDMVHAWGHLLQDHIHTYVLEDHRE